MFATTEFLERHGWRKLLTGRWSNGAVTVSRRAACKYQRTVNAWKATR